MKLNEIYHGDYLDLLEKVPDESIDLIITDPPYLHVKGGMKSKKYNTGTWKSDSKMNTAMSDFDEDKIYEFLDAVIPKMKKVNMYIFCSKLQLVSYFKYISEHKKLKFDLLVWDKVNARMKSSKFHTSDIEYIIRIYQSGVSLNKVLIDDGSKIDINHYLKKQSFKQPKGKHNTMKPTELIERLIRISSCENDIVLDTFMGSGTTAIACGNTNRQFIGSEMDEEHYKFAQSRLLEQNLNLFSKKYWPRVNKMLYYIYTLINS